MFKIIFKHLKYFCDFLKRYLNNEIIKRISVICLMCLVGSSFFNSNNIFSYGASAQVTSKCGTFNCRKGTELGKQYCSEHICQFPGCDDKKYGADYSISSFTISLPNIPPSSIPPSSIQSSNPHGYCEYHLKHCGVCGEYKLDTQLVCSKCGCVRCGELKAEGSDYCNSHKCIKCNNGQENGSVYCKDHVCSEEDCVLGKKEGSDICDLHAFANKFKCDIEDCWELKEEGHRYCVAHNGDTAAGDTGVAADDTGVAADGAYFPISTDNEIEIEDGLYEMAEETVDTQSTNKSLMIIWGLIIGLIVAVGAIGYKTYKRRKF